MKYKAQSIDLFCGAGGLSTGAKMAGISPLLAIELDQHAANTFKLNHPSATVLNQDISTVKPKDFISSTPLVVSGGPPCQGFSVANTRTRNIENPNNWMFKEYLRFIEELQPAWFVFENVEGFKSFNKGSFAQEVESEFRNLGYTTSSAVLDASDFGVPQKRNRFFIIGSKTNVLPVKFDFDQLPKLNLVTVGEAISDLPSLKNGDKVEKAEYQDINISRFALLMRGNSTHAYQNFVTENKPHIIDRYKAIQQGENWKAALEKGLLSSYSSTKNTHSGIYKRLIKNKPSVTIANYRKSMLIHPEQHRGLSLREAARIQSFPDSFIFSGPLSYQQQQVGNAVPPLLAKAIFDQIMHYSQDLLTH